MQRHSCTKEAEQKVRLVSQFDSREKLTMEKHCIYSLQINSALPLCHGPLICQTDLWIRDLFLFSWKLKHTLILLAMFILNLIICSTREKTCSGKTSYHCKFNSFLSIMSFSEEVLDIIRVKNFLICRLLPTCKHFMQRTDHVTRSWVDKNGDWNPVIASIGNHVMLNVFLLGVVSSALVQCTF